MAKIPAAAAPHPGSHRRAIDVHPVLMLLSVLVLCAVLTYVLDAGMFQRVDGQVIPGTYAVIEKSSDWLHLLGLAGNADMARPAGILTVLQAIPLGLVRNASLIFMVMFVGGMFGVFKQTGALDAGLDQLVHRSRGNIYLLAPALMCTLAAGSSFLGLISEYLVVLPVLLSMAERLRLNNLYAVAMLLVAAKIGYVASVSNPVVLPIAQGIVQVPIFSGFGMRLAVLAVFLPIGMAYLLYRIRRSGFTKADFVADARPLSRRHMGVLLSLGLAIVFMVYAGRTWHWHYNELSSFYLFVTVILAVVGGLGARACADAFIDGIKGMILPSLLIGLAGAIHVVLEQAQVLDTVVHGMAAMIHGQSPWVASLAIMFTEAGLDVLIPSTSAKAAISIPILWPIGQLSGLHGNSVVLAYLFGNGLMATVSPTSGLMLAMLAMGKVPYGQWVRFMLPLTLMLAAVATVFLLVATRMGY
ncbi:MAG: SLC13 family permease [Rhodanobacter sp.]